MQTQTLFQLCRIGYLGLVLLLTGWFINQGISGEYSIFFSFLWIIPLLIPIRGILTGKPYTYAWASFILCLYLLHACTLSYVAPEVLGFAIIEVMLLILLLIGFSFYARIKGKELGLGLKKLKK